MAMLEASLMRQFIVRVNGDAVDLSRPAQTLLAYLLLNPGVAHRREQLAGRLWPDSLDTTARKNLRNAAWQLRKAISERYLVADKETLAFDATAPYALDIAALADDAVETSVDALIKVVSACQGELLPGFDEDWVQLERERLGVLFDRRLQTLLDRLAAEARWKEAQHWAEHWITLGHVPEHAYRTLMQAHAGLGDLAGMAMAYRRCVQALKEELDVPPSTETQALYQRLSQRAAVETVVQDTAGEHRTGVVESVNQPTLINQIFVPRTARPSPAAQTPTPITRRARQQQIRFCTSSDGIRLAYATVGKGPALVKAANWLSHLEFDWTSPVWRHWLMGLSQDHTLVRYDERGCGLSDRNVNEFSLDAWVLDLETVVNALGLDRFPLFGMSRGGPIAIAYTARHPERVSHLILYGGFVHGRLRRNLSPEQKEEAEVMHQLIRIGWGRENPAFRQVFTSMFLPEGTPEQLHAFNELQRASTSPEIAARIVIASNYIDVTDLAAKLDVPTLVLHANGDLRIPFEEGRLMAALIPGARFIPLESNNHILLETEPAWQQFLTEVHTFLQTVSTLPNSAL
jgi:pimeloyl-ACP methyl ester carboxylesterase/DNA-binding SARP family transcriptional activator